MSEEKPAPAPPAAKAATTDPAMAEVIASISRIIDEDNRSASASEPVPRKKSTILELTEALTADGSVRSLGGATASGAATRTQPSPAVSDDPGSAGTPERPGDRLLSPTAAATAAAAFARLDALPREKRVAAVVPLGAGGRTLEEIVREALRPLLQTWLDEHLPDLVERLVRAEIARVVGEPGGR